MSDPTFPLEAYEALAAFAEGPGTPDAAQAEIAPLAAMVSADLKRRGRWYDSIAEGAEASRRERGGRAWLVIAVGSAWLALLLLATLVAGKIVALAFLGVSVPAVWLTVYWFRSERSRRERAAHPTCPTCGYDLTGLEDALPHEWVVGSSGPRKCPECGEAWPLIGKGT